MSVIHRMEGCGWKVIEHKAPGLAGVAEPEVMQRDLVIVHPQSDEVWVIPLPVATAEDMGGQLQGQPPKKHVEIASAVPTMPSQAMHAMPRRNGS